MGNMVLGFLNPTSGKAIYKGNDIAKMSSGERFTFHKEVQAIFQDPFAAYNPFYIVDRILELPLTQYKMGKSKREKREMIDEALHLVGLRPAEILGRYPHQLSGGQRQRVEVARALLLRPSLLVADEPVSMVDASLRANLLESIRKLNRDLQISVLYITHDLTTAYHISDAILILYRGSIVEAGNEEQVIKNPVHPYTRLLVDSIPWPDITMQWGKEPLIEPGDEAMQRLVRGGSEICKFAPRCPNVMEQCWNKRPPLYWVDRDRVAACFLYEGREIMPGEQMGDLIGSLIE
jgi:peptide/nickel transport system ATP-binding protein